MKLIAEPEESSLLGPFVPALVETWLPDDAESGHSQDLSAVLLFVDVAGFSKLSARLVAAHERGAEQTQRLVNTLFAKLIGIISRHGGGIASIAGDALQAYWTSDPSHTDRRPELGELAQRAALCAIELMQDQGTTWDPSEQLEIKALLDCGPLRLTVFGREPGFVFPVISGPLAENLPLNSGPLQAGKIFATEDFVRKTKDHAAYVANASGLAELVSVAPLEPLRPIERPRRKTRYVPDLARRLLSGSDVDWVAEFRRATVLFAGFSRSALDDTGRLAVLVGRLQSALAEHGGATVFFQTDDKGLVLIAAWGLAVNAFEDNAARAVITGRAIKHAAEQARFDCNIGISTGNLLCGVMGGKEFQQISVLSDSVNLASALSRHPEGGLLVDAETARLAGHRFAFADKGSFLPKGHTDKVSLFTPTVEARTRDTFGPRIVGRNRELETLLAAFTQTRHAPLVQVWGEAGMGKSHLGAVMAERLAENGYQTVFGYCDSLRRASALHAWRRPLDQLLAAYATRLGDTKTAALTDIAASTGMPQVQHLLLRQLLDLDDDLSTSLPTMAPAYRIQAARDAITTALDALRAEQRMVLVFEDVHWMDSASWQVLAGIREQLSEISVILLSRPHDLVDLPVQAVRMLRDDEGVKITLRPLGPSETDALVCAELEIFEQPPAMRDRIYELAEGHPLYTKELAKLFVARGLVHIDSGFAHIPSTKIDLKELEFPGGIAGAVSARISTLPTDIQLTLKVAAVLGRDADHEMIAQSHPQPGTPVEDHLAAIRASGLMDPVSRHKSRFHHALIVDTAYELLLTEQQRALHKRIAELYDAALANGASGIPNQLVAHHWDKGGVPQKALDRYLAAAKKAQENRADTEAVALLSRAIALDAEEGPFLPNERRAALHMSLAGTFMSLGHLVATDTHMSAALAIFDKAPPARTTDYLREILRHYLRIIVGPTKRKSPHNPGKLDAAQIYLGLSEVYYDRQDTLRSVHATFSAARLAASGGGDNAQYAQAMSQLAMIALYMPWALKGDNWKTRAIEMADRIGDPQTGGWVYMTTGSYAFAKGRFAEAEALTRIAIARSDEANDRKCWEYSVANLGNILRLQGQFRAAEVQDVLTYDSGHDRGVPQVKLWGVTGRMKNLWALGEWDGFEESLARARSLIADDLNKLNSAASNTIAYHVFASLNYLRHGRTEDGLVDLMAAIDLYEGLRDPQVYMVDPVSFILDAVQMLNRQNANASAIRRVLDVMARKCAKLVKLYPSARARLELVRGDLAAHRGANSKATKYWLWAVTAAESSAMPFDAAMAHHRLAIRGKLAPNDAERHLGHRNACLSGLSLKLPEGWTA